MNKKLKCTDSDELFKAILSLKNSEECYMFFEDLCTISELRAMSSRLLVAKMLRENIPYHEIAAKTGASSATISRVGRSLYYGSDGYNLVFDRIMKDN